QLIAPMSGEISSITEAADPVFAEKMVGDGIIIKVANNKILAPCDGEISFVTETKHAFAMVLDNGVEILVHIGLDTVSLHGKGFTQLVTQGTKVKVGTPIISIDRDFLIEQGISLESPILITNPEIVKSISCNTDVEAIAGITVVLEYTL
ncbi:MAG: PTS glucose transporter subunit IIA, partial [Acidaminococcaceae bacterium]|nr:PTS glucose transporter subunit IIA [Acidaminococcaceae bacterium]